MSLLRLLPLALLAVPAAAQDRVFVRDGHDWLRIEDGHAYAVHPSVVTVRSTGLRDVQGDLDRLTGELAGARVIRSNRLGFHDVLVPDGADVLEVVRGLRATGLFGSVEENAFGEYVGAPNDPSFSALWNLENTGQTGGVPGADVSALDAWDIEDGDPSIVVALLDSGTEWFHEDLAGNMWSNADEVVDGTDSDGNGFIDDIRGWDFDSDDNDPQGVFTHGTWVAGVVGAVGQNGVGIVGLAGGGNDGQGVSMMPCNVGAFAPDASVLDDAILYAAENGAHVITMSLSVPTSAAIDAAVDDAYDNYGCFIDCASGNNGFSVTYPATLPKVMAVASTNDNDIVSGFSNPGPEVEVAAPGEDVFMTAMGGSYSTASGTSFAAPHVAALAALLLSKDPTLTSFQIKQLITMTADDIGTPGPDIFSGAGRINARAALDAVNVNGSLTLYGVGTAGQAGIPAIAGSVVPTVGASFDVQIGSARPSAIAILGLGFARANLHVFGGILNISPVNALRLPLLTSPTGDGAVLVGIPDDPQFAGFELFGQWLVLDAAAAQGLAMSRGLEIVVGS